MYDSPVVCAISRSVFSVPPALRKNFCGCAVDALPRVNVLEMTSVPPSLTWISPGAEPAWLPRTMSFAVNVPPLMTML